MDAGSFQGYLGILLCRNVRCGVCDLGFSFVGDFLDEC
jgi:hypothetical protein